jgi:hypothetical protein
MVSAPGPASAFAAAIAANTLLRDTSSLGSSNLRVPPTL